MNSEVFAEWLRRQGYRVIHTPSSYWYEASPRVYQAFPYHWVIQPSEEEIVDLLRQSHAIALRYSTPVASLCGKISYHAVYDQPDYTLEGLDRRSRQNIRTGLKGCSVEPVSFQRLAEEGWCLEEDTACRQGRKPSMCQEAWHRRYLAAEGLPGFEAWGALVDGRLTASLLTFQMEDCSEYISQQCHHDFLCLRVNNALTFVVTQTMIHSPSIQSVFYTLQSLNAPASVDEFKFRMGFIAKPVRQRVVFHPMVAPLANRSTHAMLAAYLKRAPENQFCSRAEGVLRFYIQGSLAIKEQDWPECLEERRSEIVKTLPSQYPDTQNIQAPAQSYAEDQMSAIRECQIPNLPQVSEGPAALEPQPLANRMKRTLARPWNYHIKKWLKQIDHYYKNKGVVTEHQNQPTVNPADRPGNPLKTGDWVRVRSVEEIEATLDRWKELKGCAFLENMAQYCGTSQQVLQPMERFLDERDYKVKKAKGLILLKDVICQGTPVFGRCDRCCHLFWRVEWLEKIEAL